MAAVRPNPNSRTRGPRKRHWCFTSFLDGLPVEFGVNVVRYLIYQHEECPETKKRHIQGYVEFFDNKRIGQVKAVLGECHLEFRRGSRTEARDYCRKTETAIAGTQIEFGEWREDVSRKRSLLDMLRADITVDQLIEEAPDVYVRYHRGIHKLYGHKLAKKAKNWRPVVITTLIGATGVGKTRRAVLDPDHFFLPCSKNLWFDGYTDQKCLILDDFYGNIKYALFLRIIDGHELQVEIKGGYRWALWTRVIITSNNEPHTWYKFGLLPALERRLTTKGSTIVHM